jgi:hypothetical protein
VLIIHSNFRFGSVVPTLVGKSIGFATFIAKIPTEVGTTVTKKAKAGIAELFIIITYLCESCN